MEGRVWLSMASVDSELCACVRETETERERGGRVGARQSRPSGCPWARESGEHLAGGRPCPLSQERSAARAIVDTFSYL